MRPLSAIMPVLAILVVAACQPADRQTETEQPVDRPLVSTSDGMSDARAEDIIESADEDAEQVADGLRALSEGAGAVVDNAGAAIEDIVEGGRERQAESDAVARSEPE